VVNVKRKKRKATMSADQNRYLRGSLKQLLGSGLLDAHTKKLPEKTNLFFLKDALSLQLLNND
jgi:hypothetical protein